MLRYMWSLFVVLSGRQVRGAGREQTVIEVVDMTRPTTIRVIAEYYGAVDRRQKICINCGVPRLGTTMHLEHESSSSQAVYPALIPTEYLLTRLVIVDLSSLVRLQAALVLTLDVALQWSVLRRDPPEPTLLLLKFGWRPEHDANLRSCVCKIPGVSFELAEWIAANLTRVVGVATDAPTLESEQTREFNTRTIASILGRSGIYMMENVNVRRKLPERGCMAVAMPLKLQHSNYVPSRLTAFCPGASTSASASASTSARGSSTSKQVVLSLRSAQLDAPTLYPSRNHDVDLEDILSS